MGLDPLIDRTAYNIGPIDPDNSTINNNIDVDLLNTNSTYLPSLAPVPGLRLPRGDADWTYAHDYFKAYPPTLGTLDDLEASVVFLQQSIYNFFKDNIGLHKPAADLAARDESRATNSSNRALRRLLHLLKAAARPRSEGQVQQIQATSRALRKGLRSVRGAAAASADLSTGRKHYFRYRANAWQYMKEYVNMDQKSPTFDDQTCNSYFTNIYAEKNPNRAFIRPDWIPEKIPPCTPFIHSSHPPTFNDVSRVVSSMKARSCPSPLDAISIIIFKRCPILRTHLANLLSACWIRQYFPKIWRRATVTLIHKKGDTSDPQNFRPIALQPVMGKIFSSCIRNRIWDFLISNSLIDTSMQKGFWPGINGVTEHIELLSYLLSHQKKLKRDVFVVLLDLKNAFGEVHHSLIRFSLEHHHVPTDTINLIMSQYTNFFLNVSAARCNLNSGPVKVQRGVLQGDPLSPLLFNLVFDSLMSSLSNPQMQSHGILWGDGLTRSLWTQFADDAAVVCDRFKETQLILTFFQRWTAWADLIIRPDKSFAYAAAQRSGKYQQIQPSFTINGIPIPAIERGGVYDIPRQKILFRCRSGSGKIDPD